MTTIDISAEKPSVRKELESLCDKLSASNDTKLKERALITAGNILVLSDKDVRHTLGVW